MTRGKGKGEEKGDDKGSREGRVEKRKGREAKGRGLPSVLPVPN